MTDTDAPTADDQSAPPQVRLVLWAVLLAYLAQMTLNPIIAPLSRDIGLAEWQVGVMISMAGAMVVITSQWWGRRSQSKGRKPVLITALTIATISMVLFAVLVRLGMTGAVAGTTLFVGLVIVRGVLFGVAIAAVPVTVIAYIADVTPDEQARVKGMANIGAINGIAVIGGALIGGALAGFGLMTPIVVVPVLLLAGLVTVIRRMRPEGRHRLIPDPRRVSPFDTRAWPFLLAGFGLFSAFGFLQIVTGFIVQDRFDLASEPTAVVTGSALLAAGIGLIAAQALIVRRLGWPPRRLLITGTAIASSGMLALLPNLPIGVFVLSMLTMGIGFGIAIPGYTAGSTLLMDKDEQGSFAGLIGANNALTFMVAPALGTAMYSWWPLLPVIASATVAGLVLFFVATHARFKVHADGMQDRAPA